MPRKKRSEEEVKAILKAHSDGMPVKEIQKTFAISDAAFYRLLNVSKGLPPEPTRKQQENKIAKLEKALRDREFEIALLKRALKKS